MQSKEFFESIPLGICVLRRDQAVPRVLFANHTMLYLMGSGYASSYEVEGMALTDFWPEPEINDLARKLRSPNPPRDYTIPINNGKRQRWAKITLNENTYENQDVWVLWVTDISASKSAEERLKREVEHADALAEAKSNFLATMSHEIRTPMQAIYGFLELISEENPPPAIQTMVDTARHSASGLLEILDDILDFAKIDAQQMELDIFEVPVRTLVRGTLEALSVKVHGKNIKLIDDIEQNVPFVVAGDPKRLRQIILNLSGNALKFTEFGSVTVHVSCSPKILPVPRHGLVLRFEIRDTGIGMSEEVQNRLFKPFSQADNSTSRKYGGTGLGLSICKRLVELMGGKIGVDSTPGSGSVFWFEIPTEEIGTETSNTELPSLDGVSILSVEDHPQGAREIVKSLQSMGARVESCSTCKEAIDLVKRRPFDIGVIDQGLPDGLGLDLIREIMDIRPSMGLIMYTVRDDIGLQHSLHALGVTYLPKPASRIGLGTAVKDATRTLTQISADGPNRLLIAEDNDTVREVIRRQLTRIGVEADFVGNGRDALKALDSGRYGILFTDLHMPDMDGYALTRTIRAHEQKTGEHFPIVVLTADVQMVQRQVYLAAGFDECLLKPISMGQLRRLLMRWRLLDEEASPRNDVPSQPRMGGSIDVDALMEQMGADRAEAIQMLRMFADMTEPLVNSIKDDARADPVDLKELAHSLKGAARSACCTALGDLASRLQEESERGGYSPDLIREIEDEFARVRNAVHDLASGAIR